MKIIRKQGESGRVSGIAERKPPFAWIYEGILHVGFCDLDNPNTHVKTGSSTYDVLIDKTDLQHIVEAFKKQSLLVR
jgi:hypothetical protein